MGVPVKRAEQDRRGLPARARLDRAGRGRPGHQHAHGRRCAQRRARDPPRRRHPRDPLPDDARRRRLGGARDRERRSATASPRCCACRSCTASHAAPGSGRAPHGRALPAGPAWRERSRGVPATASAGCSRSRANEQLGAYRLLRVADPRRRPRPRRAVRDARRRARWGGGEDERPFLARALSSPASSDGRRHFLLEDVGPGTRAAVRAASPGSGCGRSGRSAAASARRSAGAARDPRRGRRRHRAACDPARTLLAASPHRALLGFRDRERARAARAAARTRSSPATTAASATAAASPSCSRGSSTHDARRGGLRVRARRRCSRACAPAAAARGRARAARARGADGVRLRRLLRLRGAGRATGGYLRVCVDGPVIDAERARRRGASTRGRPRERRLLRDEARAPRDQRLGHLRRARRARGLRRGLLEDFPFAAYVSKTITLEPRAGNPPPRMWELAGGVINSIGLPNKGLERYLAEDLPALAGLTHARPRRAGGALRACPFSRT